MECTRDDKEPDLIAAALVFMVLIGLLASKQLAPVKVKK